MRFHDVTRRPVHLAAVLVLSIATAGCGAGAAPGDGGATSGAPTAPAASVGVDATSDGSASVKRDAAGAVEACALLSVEQIKAVVGSAVTEAVPYGTAECRWTVQPLTDFAGSERPWVDVQFFENDYWMRSVEAAPGTNGVVAIDGLGDRAFRTNQFRHLWVQRGSDVFVVRSSLPALTDESEASRAAAEAIESALARLVLDQL